MVCKKEVINWFRDLSACRRIEFMCALMDCCGPLELRFLGTYIEDLGRRDYDRLREMELNANDVNYLSKLINISDIRILDKVLTSLALMYSTCKDGARVLFKTLKEHTDTILNGGCSPREPSSETHEKVVLLAVMALNHPAFTFSEKQALKLQLSALLQAVESIAVVAIVPSEQEEEEDDTVNGIQDLTGSRQEPQGQLLAEISAAQPPTAGPSNGDTTGEGPQAVMNSNDDAASSLENDNNFAHQDPENPVFICNIEGKGLKKRTSDRRYEYTFMVHWSDGTVTNVGKTHGQLLEFQCQLNELFPLEAGEQHQDRIIPYLPGKRIFSSAQKGELAEDMLPEIAEYAKQLASLPQHILQCDLMYDFFQSTESPEIADAGTAEPQTNPTAPEQDVKSSPSPTQVYQQLPQNMQQQQQIYQLQPDVEQQQLQLHYQQQMMSSPLQQQQQQYHGQMLRQHQASSPYTQASLPQQMMPQQVTVQQPLNQHQQQSMHQQQPLPMQLQQQQQQQHLGGELGLHQGQLQPLHQGMPTAKNQSHPVPASQSQQLPPPHPVHPQFPDFYGQQQDLLAAGKQKPGAHQQFGKYSKQPQPQHQQQKVRQLQHPQQPQLADSVSPRCAPSDPTPAPTTQPTSHHNLTALVSQMHISQHHQVNLSTPNIPPAVVGNPSSSSMGICKQGTAVTSSVTTTTASGGSVYYQTVTSISPRQSTSADPFTTADSNPGSSQQQSKALVPREQSKHSNSSLTHTQIPPTSVPKHAPPTPTYTASLMPQSPQLPLSPTPSHSLVPPTQSAALNSRSWSALSNSNSAPPMTTGAPPNSNMAPPHTNMAPPHANMSPPNSNATMAPPHTNVAPPHANMSPPNSNATPPYYQYQKDNVDPLIGEWLKKQRLHKYDKFFEGKTMEKVLQLSDKEVDSWDIVQGAKGRIKSQLEQLRQKGLCGLNGMCQLMAHSAAPPLYYQELYLPFNAAMPSHSYATPGLCGEGTGSEGSSSPSSPRESSDETERESEGSEGSVLSSPDARPMARVGRESGAQQQHQPQQLAMQDTNGTQAAHAAQQVNPHLPPPQMSPLPPPSPPHGSQLQGNPQLNPQTSPNPTANLPYNYGTLCPSPNVEQHQAGPVNLRRLIDVNPRQPDSRLTPVPMMEMTAPSVKSGNGSHGGSSSHLGGSGGIGNGGSGMNLGRQQVPMVAHLGDPNMMSVPPPNVPPPLPPHNQMDIGSNIPPQVVNMKPQQQQQQQQHQQQQSLPGLQYSIECADSNIFKMPSIVVPDVVPTSTVSPGPSIPSSLPLTHRNDGSPPIVSGTNSPRLLPSPVNPNFQGARASFTSQHIPATFALRLGGEQTYQAPTSVTYATSMAQSPSINLSNTNNVYDSTPMVYNNNNQTSYPAAGPGCTSCGCSGQCGTAGSHHGPVHHFPVQSAYPSSQVAYQSMPSFFPGGLPGMPPPPNSVVPASPRFPGPMLPFQNMPGEMPYGGNGQFGLMPHGQVYLGGMNYRHRGNPGNHGGQGGKKLHCFNCGGVGHRQPDCGEVSMESITQNSLYRLNFKPVPEPNNSTDS